MRKLTVNLKDHSYDIIIENNLLENINTYVKNVYKNKKIFIITDDKVAPLYLDKVLNSLKKDFLVDYVIIKNGEASKNLETYAYVCEKLIEKGVKRQEALIALGGGVIGDLTGFVAASLYRGIPYIGVPTSLLADMDSSIGGKTGIDFAGRKNILGAFKQPLAVLIDPKTFESLDKREFNNGMGELIKHGAIGNKKLLELLKEHPDIDENIIYESLSVKKEVVEKDEFDLGDRMKLNFGHTFGHAIELKYGYKHGEAVAIGMLMALKMGIDLKITNPNCYQTIYDILKLYDLPLDEYDYHDYLKDILYDKKNIAGTVNFIFLTEIGNCVIYKISESEVLKLYESNHNSK